MNPAIMVGASAAARHGAAQKRITQRLREMGAVRRETAQPLPDLPKSHQRDVARLIERGIIRKAQPGTYYLDQDALSEDRARARTVAWILAVLGAGLLAALTLLR